MTDRLLGTLGVACVLALGEIGSFDYFEKDIHSFAVSEYNIVTTILHSGHRERDSHVQKDASYKLPLPTEKLLKHSSSCDHLLIRVSQKPCVQ
ncbi:hypothetical protein GE21DRAFT_1054354 [Neurospora crassa]|nr:hypothetical protein GE21DRAFT_1054354 [Neurospora crassa]